MTVEKSKNNLYIKSRFFCAKQILNSGQVFRFCASDNGYLLYAGGELAQISVNGEETHIYCTDEDFFYNYFDIETDYGAVTETLSRYPAVKKAVEYGRGIRILKQQKPETIISFIISANNNIKRISGIISNICSGLGEKKVFAGKEYYAFPTIEKLASAGEEFYRNAGAGYRAKYIHETANMIAGGFDIENIGSLDTKSAEKALMKLKGIGKKVADCILLFAYGKTDIFPTDTWIEKVYCDEFGGQKMCREKISDYFADMFKDLSGYAQQYLFYHKKGEKTL